MQRRRKDRLRDRNIHNKMYLKVKLMLTMRPRCTFSKLSAQHSTFDVKIRIRFKSSVLLLRTIPLITVSLLFLLQEVIENLSSSAHVRRVVAVVVQCWLLR